MTPRSPRCPHRPAPDLHSHPEAVRARQEFEHLITTWPPSSSSPHTSEGWWLEADRTPAGRTLVLALAHRALRALEEDPTLAVDPEGRRLFDLIAELNRQLKPLGRQVALVRFAQRLHEDPDLTDAQRERGLNRLGKLNPRAEAEHRTLLGRAEELVAQIEARVNPAWGQSGHRRRLAQSFLPRPETTIKATDLVRYLVEEALAVDPELPQARQVLAAADQIDQLLGTSARTCAASECGQPLPPADPGRERRYCSPSCRTRTQRRGAKR